MAVSRAISNLKDNRRELLDDRRLCEMEGALYRFFTARVGLRFLTEHHILGAETPGSEYLRKKQACVAGECRLSEMMSVNGSEKEEDKGKRNLGCIQKNVDPVKEATFVAKQVERDCRNVYGAAPPIHIVGCSRGKGKVETEFTYVPHHLRYMLAELLKNSCRATIKRYMRDGVDIMGGQQAELPKIVVVVVKGKEDVTIKVADRGGGVPRSEMNKIWTFAHSTYRDEGKNTMNNFDRNEFTGDTIRGFGLPLARIYARYFGGELTLKSMEGYGVDAYLHLPTLGLECENLPKKVLRSPGNQTSNADQSDLDDELTATTANRSRGAAFPAALDPAVLEKLSQRAL